MQIKVLARNSRTGQLSIILSQNQHQITEYGHTSPIIMFKKCWERTWDTSMTKRMLWPCTSRADRIEGSSPSKRTSTTGPMTYVQQSERSTGWGTTLTANTPFRNDNLGTPRMTN